MLRFLEFIRLHGVSRAIRVNQAKCLIKTVVETFAEDDNIELLISPVDDYRCQEQ